MPPQVTSTRSRRPREPREPREPWLRAAFRPAAAVRLPGRGEDASAAMAVAVARKVSRKASLAAAGHRAADPAFSPGRGGGEDLDLRAAYRHAKAAFFVAQQTHHVRGEEDAWLCCCRLGTASAEYALAIYDSFAEGRLAHLFTPDARETLPFALTLLDDAVVALQKQAAKDDRQRSLKGGAARRASVTRATLALVHGRRALVAGSARAQLQAALAMRRCAERSIALDEHSWLGYLLLGMWHTNVASAPRLRRVLAKLKGFKLKGNRREALYNAKVAFRLNPEPAATAYELARAYAALRDGAGARKYLQIAASSTRADVGDALLQQAAAEALRFSPA